MTAGLCYICGKPTKKRGKKYNITCSAKCLATHRSRVQTKRMEAVKKNIKPNRCKVCGKPTPLIKGNRYEYRKTCSYKCMIEQRSQISTKNNRRRQNKKVKFSVKKTIKSRKHWNELKYDGFSELDSIKEQALINSIVGKY